MAARARADFREAVALSATWPWDNTVTCLSVKV